MVGDSETVEYSADDRSGTRRNGTIPGGSLAQKASPSRRGASLETGNRLQEHLVRCTARVPKAVPRMRSNHSSGEDDCQPPMRGRSISTQPAFRLVMPNSCTRVGG